MKKTIYLVGIILLAIACGKGNKAAFEELERAKALYEINEFASARSILDSIKLNYPNDAKVQRARLDMTQQVDYAEIARNRIYIDSLLPIRQAELEAVLPQFRYEKNDEYEDLGRFIDKAYNPSFENTAQFLKAIVNEKGEIYLISSYSGGDIKHTAVKVSDTAGNYAQTEEIPRDGGLNYSFKDVSGRHYETVTFQKGKDNGVIMFIYNYGEGKLNLDRLGGKKVNTTVLTNNEKESIKRMVDLSMILQEIDKLQAERNKGEKRLEYYQAKAKASMDEE